MAFALLSRARSKTQDSVKPVPKRRFARGQHSTDSRSGFEKSVFQPHTAALPTVPVIQTKLKIGEPNDKFEQEADQVADEVMRMSEPQPVNEVTRPKPSVGQRIQRLCTECEEELRRQPIEEEEEEGTLQTKAVSSQTPEVTSQVQAQVNALRGGGQPLLEPVRAFFEPRFGYDFSQVRVHIDTRAAESARAVNALAYTAGHDIVFGRGQYAPETSEGQQLLAHELVHVVQQQSAVPQFNVTARQSGAMDELEADQRAWHVVQGQPNLPKSLVSKKFSGPTIIDKARNPQSSHPSTQGVLSRKPSDKDSPVPTWNQLPASAQADLMSRDYDEEWFARQDDALRLTLLNLYVKLKRVDLWKFVTSESGTSLGDLHFNCAGVDEFKRTLRNRDDFRSSEKPPTEWSSREMRIQGQLHFKHFENWPETRVQAHIDPHGLLPKSKGWWLFPPVPLLGMAMHGMDAASEGRKDVFYIRQILLNQGLDPVPLKGVGATLIQRKEISSASEKPGAPVSQRRSLIPFERREAQRVFGNSLNLDKIILAESRVMSIGGYARTVPGVIYFPLGTLSNLNIPWFIHELTHCWQYQHGITVIETIIHAIARKYEYGGEEKLITDHAAGKKFTDFNTEQQGDILRDYYIALKEGKNVSAWQPFIAEMQGTRGLLYTYPSF